MTKRKFIHPVIDDFVERMTAVYADLGGTWPMTNEKVRACLSSDAALDIKDEEKRTMIDMLKASYAQFDQKVLAQELKEYTRASNDELERNKKLLTRELCSKWFAVDSEALVTMAQQKEWGELGKTVLVSLQHDENEVRKTLELIEEAKEALSQQSEELDKDKMDVVRSIELLEKQKEEPRRLIEALEREQDGPRKVLRCIEHEKKELNVSFNVLDKRAERPRRMIAWLEKLRARVRTRLQDPSVPIRDNALLQEAKPQ
jgi:chromosome segregation ATPase